MKKEIKIIAIAAILMAIPGYMAVAGEPQETSLTRQAGFAENLLQINRVKPLQNPQYTSANDILKRRIMDYQNKVVGEVVDTIIDKNGYVASLLVDFDRMHLRQNVFIDYQKTGVEGTADGYVLALREDEISQRYPELLADIQTAAGEEGDVISVKKLRGEALRNERGRKIGTVKDILFAPNGRRVEALYVSVDYDTVRDIGIAVPYNAVKFEGKMDKPNPVLAKADAETLIDFAKSQR